MWTNENAAATETSRDRLWFFVLLWTVYGISVVLLAPYIFASAAAWTLLPARIFAAAAPFFIWYSRRHRKELERADFHMIYLPFVVWWAAMLAVQLVTWRFCQGRAAFGPYGTDKSLSNFVVEPELALFFAGLPLLRFVVRDQGARDAMGRRLRILAVVAAALVAVLVPGLPE